MSNERVLDKYAERYVLPQPEECPSDVYERVIEPCLNYDREKRPTYIHLYKTLEDIEANSNTDTEVQKPGNYITIH